MHDPLIAHTTALKGAGITISLVSRLPNRPPNSRSELPIKHPTGNQFRSTRAKPSQEPRIGNTKVPSARLGRTSPRGSLYVVIAHGSEP
jgi:hypothetical protein